MCVDVVCVVLVFGVLFFDVWLCDVLGFVIVFCVCLRVKLGS